MQDLSPDVIGTNPKYPPIVDHSWLTPQAYDNYPSDNNSVRVLPKIADLWNISPNDKGFSLIPNLTIQHTGADSKQDPSQVVCAAKKAMMAGLKGKELADFLRARFSSGSIVAAKDALAKLSEEQGLLGNVYIDASAFTSAKEAEQFLTTHRTRLAQDIVINESKLNPAVIDVLASKFHKNVVASMTYDENLFSKYRMHLQSAGRIEKDFVIDSKETLRRAFLTEKEREATSVAKKEEEKALTPEEIKEGIMFKSDKMSSFKRLAAEEQLFRTVKPIIECAFQNRSKGKTGSDLKEVLLTRFAREELCDAAKYLGLMVSEASSELIDQLVEAGKITQYIGDEMKRLAKAYPPLPHEYEAMAKPQSSVKGFLYPLTRKNAMSTSAAVETVYAAMDMLRKGEDIGAVKSNLLVKGGVGFTEDAADEIIAAALKEFNAAPAGVKANVPVAAPKNKLFENKEPRFGSALPDAPEDVDPQLSKLY